MVCAFAKLGDFDKPQEAHVRAINAMMAQVVSFDDDSKEPTAKRLKASEAQRSGSS